MAWIVNWWYLVTKTNPQLPWNLLYMEGWYFLFVMQKMVLIAEKLNPSHACKWESFYIVWPNDNPHPSHMHCLFIQTKLQHANDSQKELMGHKNPIACFYPSTR